MDELAKIQSSLEDMKASQDANKDLYDNVHHYEKEIKIEIPSGVKKTSILKNNGNDYSGIIETDKGKIKYTKLIETSDLGNIEGDVDNLEMIEAGNNIEGFINYSSNNYYLLFLLFLLLLILLLK